MITEKTKTLDTCPNRFLMLSFLENVETRPKTIAHIVPVMEIICPNREGKPYTSTWFQLVSTPIENRATKLINKTKTAVTKEETRILCNKEYLILTTSVLLR